MQAVVSQSPVLPISDGDKAILERVAAMRRDLRAHKASAMGHWHAVPEVVEQKDFLHLERMQARAVLGENTKRLTEGNSDASN